MHGTRADAEALRDEIAEVLTPMGLRLSPDKTLITHIDEGLDFLGWRIQRHRKRGTGKRLRLHLPGQESLVGHHGKGEDDLPDEQKPTVSSPAAPAQPGAAGLVRPLPARGVQSDLRLPAQAYVWRQVMHWLRRKHGNGSRPPGRTSAAATATVDGGPTMAR